jgi:pyroglutamyl-peptidase
MTVVRQCVLLTGFGPFPGVPQNISAELVRKLADEASRAFAQTRVASEILPTEWHAGPSRMARAFAALKPSLVLHFGVAKEATGFRLETQAFNVCRFAPDAVGAHPPSEILHENGDGAHAATVPTRDIAVRLAGIGVPASLSHDAGGYLCNAVLYYSLSLAREAPWRCRIGFVHMPARYEDSDLDEVTALRGGLEIIRACLEAGSH